MKKFFVVSLTTMALISACAKKQQSKDFKDGDIIFQYSDSMQSKALEFATKSKYTHCGIVFVENGKYYVCEAVQPVRVISLKTWISHGIRKHYVVKRLKNYRIVLTAKNIKKLKKSAKKFLGKRYDLKFVWSDNRIYCSELVWKAYKRGLGIEVCKLKKFGDYDLSHPLVQLLIKERLKGKIPQNEPVVAPIDILKSNKFYTVYSEK